MSVLISRVCAVKMNQEDDPLQLLSIASAVVRAATSLKAAAVSLWSAYNSEDSLLPLYGPLILFWWSTYVYCRWVRKDPSSWHKWDTLHNLHNVGAILLGILSISSASSDTASHWTLNERVPILWSLGYFAVDAVDCVGRNDRAYLFHALCCVVLGLANYHIPLLRTLRMNSKATFCELSSPFLHRAKQTRQASHFALFAVAFTCCRVLWVPVLYYQLRTAGMDWKHPVLLTLAAFYSLNCVWYSKILRILVEGATGPTIRKED